MSASCTSVSTTVASRVSEICRRSESVTVPYLETEPPADDVTRDIGERAVDCEGEGSHPQQCFFDRDAELHRGHSTGVMHDGQMRPRLIGLGIKTEFASLTRVVRAVDGQGCHVGQDQRVVYIGTR